MPRIGIIGGSGIYQMEIIKNAKEFVVETPFGMPSDAITVGEISGVEVAFLPRHGRGHVVAPHKINNAANIFALKELGVECLILLSAVGSLNEKMAPCDFVVGEQLVDRTFKRRNTFFEDGVVAHVSLADPFCKKLSDVVFETAKSVGLKVHRGSYICIEGPQFSTRKESELYRSWGLDVIGMTAAPEIKLAREAEMCLAAVFAVTDYDCWHEGHDDVSVSSVVENLKKNTENLKKLIEKLVPCLEKKAECECQKSMEYAVITSEEMVEENLDLKVREVLLDK